ncbi:hypothetical protein [Actinokineospora globicatena]|uniref:Excreted virulence factor EspC, type VII ESX diderm n=1 Tax=Actinokineospora globicatena TaxID=103729 RepID=A0A9W6QQV6_9PSEU|nr:hypothetical protein [Actinokineospora globicatena]GLW94868.1 hypothetical protein Aglo03_56840 [Actinokineospora globicatena]
MGGESDAGERVVTSGYRGEEDAFHAYTAGVRPLADQLRESADRGLAGPGAFDEHAFSKIGSEVGLAQALRVATQRQLDGARGLAESLGGTAAAVRATWTNLEATEHDSGTALRRAAGEPA